MKTLTKNDIIRIKAETVGVTPGPYTLGSAEGEGLCFMPVHAPGWGAFATFVVRMHEASGEISKMRAENIMHFVNCTPETIAALCDLALLGLKASDK